VPRQICIRTRPLLVSRAFQVKLGRRWAGADCGAVSGGAKSIYTHQEEFEAVPSFATQRTKAKNPLIEWVLKHCFSAEVLSVDYKILVCGAQAKHQTPSSHAVFDRPVAKL
jgi:hypothetical protein